MTKPSTSFYVKNEAYSSLNKFEMSNYTGVGFNCAGRKVGSLDVFLAGKCSNTKYGGFAELKYTTPKVANSNWAAESRTRACVDKLYKDGESSVYMTQRLAAKGNWDLGKGVGIYQIAGVNSKISLQGKGLQSITPTSFTGVSYKINNQASIYGELELSDEYSVLEKKWGNFNCGVYFGAKYTF